MGAYVRYSIPLLENGVKSAIEVSGIDRALDLSIYKCRYIYRLVGAYVRYSIPLLENGVKSAIDVT